jgi:hydroxymethylpyrimidine/phosphomethylpyrimidine kinase
MRGVDAVRVALTIAGSDSGGGAGIQADLRAFATLGVHGAAAITALTAQNTRGVFGLWPVEPAFVAQQIDVVAEDLAVAATKTGMLVSAEIVEIVADRIAFHHLTPLVVDTVLLSTSGAALLEPNAIEMLRTRLLPLATVVTPNLAEAEVLSGLRVTTITEMQEAARRIHALGPANVVVKGGHLGETEAAVDLLFDGIEMVELRGPRLTNLNRHGTGCTFASAIAAGLAQGLGIAGAVAQAKDLVTEGIRYGLPIGHGTGPVNGLALLYERAGFLHGPDTFDPYSG